jgi:hypothetical protein
MVVQPKIARKLCRKAQFFILFFATFVSIHMLSMYQVAYVYDLSIYQVAYVHRIPIYKVVYTLKKGVFKKENKKKWLENM